MTVRQLDENGDITGWFISERDEIAQTVSTRLSLFSGEYFRDITEGTPWFDSILGKTTNDGGAKDAILRARISQTDGVIRLTSYSATYDDTTRQYNVEAGILTKYGDGTIIYSSPTQ